MISSFVPKWPKKHWKMRNGIGIGIGILQFSFLFIVFVFLMMPQASSADINVWPKPTTFSWPRPQFTVLSPNLTVSIFPNHNNKYLTAAVSRYLKLFLTENYRPLVAVPNDLNLTSSPPIQALKIQVSDVTTGLTLGVNESYTLSIPSPRKNKYSYQSTNTVLLTAETVWGAMRGLETFSQLIIYGRQGARVASGVYVRDHPLYLHRGVMLDTGRNYYPVEDLFRLIKALCMNKLNVFHWHITDSQSFPLVLPSEPDLAGKGSYGDDMMYSSEDVKRVVEFGLEHGVRVLPEIDMPAHTGSWAEAYPDIVTCEGKFWLPAGSNDVLAAEPGTGQLNPLNPKTYQVVKNVISDMVNMFPDTFYHAGADEINPNCWKSDPSIQDYISNNNRTLGKLLEVFVTNTLPFILSQNRTVVYWEDVLLDGLINVSSSILLPKENIILQTWNNGPNNTKRIVSSGYRAIVSSSDYYYLDCGHGDFVGNNSLYNQPPGTDLGNGGSWCGPFKTWQTIYNYDITYGLSEEEAKLVIGGEVALWSEQSDPTVMDSRIWPRASAMAETLWSGNKDEMGMKRYAEATDRLNEWRNRMVKRGIGAEPIQPLWCVRNPGMCNQV